MSDEWFQEKIAPDSDTEDGCHPPAAQALKAYLRHQTDAKSGAQSMTQPIITATNPRDELWRLWTLLEDALVELPESEIDNLLHLIKAIEDLPEPDFSALPPNHHPPHGKLWKELPGFGHLWSDGYQGGLQNILARSDPSERDQLRNQHVRKAYVEARLAVAGLAGIPLDWGYETVTNALEFRDAVLDFEVPAALQWLVVARRCILADADVRKQSWALERDSSLWKGEKVMTHRRWAFWVDRLSKLRDESEVVRNAVDYALLEKSIGLQEESRGQIDNVAKRD